LPNSFANLLEAIFCGFGKNPRMPSTFSKLLELRAIQVNKLYHRVEVAEIMMHDGFSATASVPVYDEYNQLQK